MADDAAGQGVDLAGGVKVDDIIPGMLPEKPGIEKQPLLVVAGHIVDVLDPGPAQFRLAAGHSVGNGGGQQIDLVAGKVHGPQQVQDVPLDAAVDGQSAADHQDAHGCAPFL